MACASRAVLALCGLALALPAQSRPATAQAFDHSIRPLLHQFCLKCHATREQKGDLDLEQFTSLDRVQQEPRIWRRVAEQLGDQEMPPAGEPQPDAAQRAQLLAWIQAVLDGIAQAQAGDPGPVVLRRLSNAEYTWTVRDLTGVAALDPAREFPVDGAAGEGFSNVGNALVMSPSLLSKYLEAGKGIAAHAVLLPDGIRFAPGTTRRDWTEAILGEIRAFYRGFTDPGGGDVVNLQGIVFATNEGGRLPLAKYLAATLELRDAAQGSAAVAAVAQARGLNARYLGLLLAGLESREPSLLLDPVRAAWRRSPPATVAELVADIAAWQKALWKFSSVGHIGKADGPKAWQEPVDPWVTRQELRCVVPPAADGAAVTLYLAAGDAGDGAAGDWVVWSRPRLVAKGRPDLLLRDVRDRMRQRLAWRARLFAGTAGALAAADAASAAQGPLDGAALAQRHGIDVDILTAWFAVLGIGSAAVDSHYTTRMEHPSRYDFVRGWGSGDTPLLVANASDQQVRIPGTLRAHSVAVHPSPTLQAAVGWRSPVATTVRVTARIQHAHHDCGNGVTWALEWRRGALRQRLASGTAQGTQEGRPEPATPLVVQPGDLVSLLIGPRDGNHACDLTAVDLTLTEPDAARRAWDLAQDCAPDVLAGNPHADRLGHAGVWHFYTEPEPVGSAAAWVVPAGSLLARWQWASSAEERAQCAATLQQLLTSGPPADVDSPDGRLYRQLASLRGPLLGQEPPALAARDLPPRDAEARDSEWGLDPAQFGRTPDGRALDPASLCVPAPRVVAVRLPAELVAGCELVTDGSLEPQAGADGSVQLQVGSEPPTVAAGLVPSGVTASATHGPWTADPRRTTCTEPIVVTAGSAAQRRIAAACDAFRALFPVALCYTRIVPVDEVVTLTQFYREDQHLVRLMLDAGQARTLDRLWDELHFVSQDALTQVDAFEQIWQFATQDADPKVFEPLREPIRRNAAAFRGRLAAAEPRHLDAVLAFAGRAYRRPLASAEADALRGLYQRLRAQELSHDAAIRLTLARVLLAPAFLYHAEEPGPGQEPVPVSDWELASRLSYFLWSSAPDAELTATAASGTLHQPDVLVAQARRMLRDPRVRRLATEFGCAWLQIHGFDQPGEKSERHFPTFHDLQGAMYEESIRFLTDLFQRGGSVLELLDADHTFLNAALAEHYGIPGVVGAEWRRVAGVQRYGRGGILGLATVLSRQSGASRTSPILRGNWLCEVLLGERLPRPPKDVPRLPEDEAQETLTMRQLTERHTRDPRCARCHVRIDAFGFALEGFDAIGRRRERDLGGRPVDTRVKAPDGTAFAGLDGLRGYLLTTRRDAFLRQFCRKLLGYALGRAVQLADEPLLTELLTQLPAHHYAMDRVVETIVRSRQFQHIRGRDQARKE